MSRHQLKPQPTAAERMEKRRKTKEQPKVDYYLAGKVKKLAYDYGQIPEEHRDQVQQVAVEIKKRQRQVAQDMIQIGLCLDEVRELLIDDGKYHEWLKVEFGMSIGSASEYRSIAARFDGKVSIIETLSPTIIRRLAGPSVPNEAVEAVIAAASATSKPLRVQDAMAIVKPFLPVKPPRLVKPKQLPGPVAEPDDAIEAEYSIVQEPHLPTVTLRPELLRKMIDGAAHKVFMPFLTRDEHDELFIALTRALKEEP